MKIKEVKYIEDIEKGFILQIRDKETKERKYYHIEDALSVICFNAKDKIKREKDEGTRPKTS